MKVEMKAAKQQLKGERGGGRGERGEERIRTMMMLML
jgi:hypothetical protein